MVSISDREFGLIVKVKFLLLKIVETDTTDKTNCVNLEGKKRFGENNSHISKTKNQ